jgi:hypothetical protein
VQGNFVDRIYSNVAGKLPVAIFESIEGIYGWIERSDQALKLLAVVDDSKPDGEHSWVYVIYPNARRLPNIGDDLKSHRA